MSKLDELNALEESEAEQAAGLSLGVLEVEGGPKVAMLGALAWVHRRRTEPTLTYEAYMRSVKTRDIVAYLFGEDEDDAAAPEGEDPAGPFPEDAERAGEGGGGAEGEVLPRDADPAE